MSAALRPDRRLVFGVAFIALLVVVVLGTIASYRGTFKDTMPVTVHAARAGQTLAPGAVVKLRGVEVGTVETVRTEGDGVAIELALDPDQARRIPADVTVQIVPPTAFGAKYVQLTDPASGTSGRIRAGEEIGADRVTVEVDEAFQSLTRVLDVVRPAEVSGALTALADAVDTRGEKLGDLVRRTDRYLGDFNPNLEELTADLRAGDDVAATYDAARPDLIEMVTALATTGDTVSEEQSRIRRLAKDLRAFSTEADAFLKESGSGIVDLTETFEPVADVLARYSPELPCMILGLAGANPLAEAAVGGTHPGVTTITRVVPGRDPYLYPKDLPIVGDDRGPQCHGLPYITPEEAQAPAPVFRTGTSPYAGPPPNPAERATTTLINLLIGGGNIL